MQPSRWALGHTRLKSSDCTLVDSFNVSITRNFSSVSAHHEASRKTTRTQTLPVQAHLGVVEVLADLLTMMRAVHA
jgi:hypothetical protein